MEEQNNNKRMLNIELNDNVKKVSITGMGSDEKVVMKQELDEEELDQATGGSNMDLIKSLDDKEKEVDYPTSNLTKIPCNIVFDIRNKK